VSKEVIADAGPLIGLARTGHLELLHELYGSVLIPPRVVSELRLSQDRPGARALKAAVAEGWLREVELETAEKPEGANLVVDSGEAEAIALARERPLRFLLLDERRGRQLARQQGLPVVGTGGVLLAAKHRELIPRIAPALEKLEAAGYRFSEELRAELLELAGEASDEETTE